jgi:hypothetical protein
MITPETMFFAIEEEEEDAFVKPAKLVQRAIALKATHLSNKKVATQLNISEKYLAKAIRKYAKIEDQKLFFPGKGHYLPKKSKKGPCHGN